MAELAALGVASSIVQLVHFGASLFSQVREVGRTAHGICEEEIELEAIARDLKTLLLKLKPNTAPARCTQVSSDEHTLNELTRPCRALADELLRIIDDLKVKDLHYRKWKSFKQALKHVRKEKDIRDLEIRLAKLQAQISTHLITTLR